MSSSKTQLFAFASLCVSMVALVISIQHDPNQNVTTNVGHQSQDSSNDLTNLQSRVTALSSQLNSDETSLHKLEWESIVSDHSAGTFTPTDQTFRAIKSTYGDLLISLKNAEKYGDGYKLTFDFGNPTSLTISGLKGKVSWKPAIDYKRYFADQTYKADIDAKTNSKDFQILNDLYPGAWNVVSVTIGPASEETIGNISIENLESDSVKMRTIRAPN